jgi:hypothetical protein
MGKCESDGFVTVVPFKNREYSLKCQSSNIKKIQNNKKAYTYLGCNMYLQLASVDKPKNA